MCGLMDGKHSQEIKQISAQNTNIRKMNKSEQKFDQTSRGHGAGGIDYGLAPRPLLVPAPHRVAHIH